jgi:hypothetical protein
MKLSKLSLTLFGMSLLFAVPARAELKHVEMSVFGMD